MRLIIYILIFSSVLCAQSEGRFDDVDYALSSAFVISQILDYGLTNHGISNGGAELNLLYGKRPSSENIALIKFVTTSSFLYLCYKAEDQRKWLLVMGNIIGWYCVFHNTKQVGFNIKILL